ncbi:MAG: hypothetical protein OXG06_05540, partial [Gammaproteobacteria bacterium]|nr:hypothetical protein [Gammaproteobacteria bacterium]
MGVPALAHDSNCDNSATTGNPPIHCEEGSTSTDDISIDVDGIDIDTTADGDAGRGIAAIHEGSGDITIDIGGTTSAPSTIDTTGTGSDSVETAHAITAIHRGAGSNITITVENTKITTTGARSRGISSTYYGTGNSGMKIELGSGTGITTGGNFSAGVHGYLLTDQGDLDVDLLDGTSITTKGATAYALELTHGKTAGNGNLLLDLTGTSLETQGTQNAHGVYASHGGTGNIEIRAPTNGGSITTRGKRSSGITAVSGNGNSNIIIDLTGLRITTESTDTSANSYGVAAWNKDTGNTDIDVRGGFIKTSSENSYGLYGLHYGKNSAPLEVFGNINIATHDNHAITTTGPTGHGIVAYHNGTADTDRRIDITVGGTITTSGTDAQGVR